MRKLSEAFVLNFVGIILISMKNEVFCVFFFSFLNHPRFLKYLNTH